MKNIETAALTIDGGYYNQSEEIRKWIEIMDAFPEKREWVQADLLKYGKKLEEAKMQQKHNTDSLKKGKDYKSILSKETIDAKESELKEYFDRLRNMLDNRK
jgi:hypothetical protein